MATEVRILTEWMEQDVLAMAGPLLAEREELYDFILTELERYQDDGPHCFKPFLRLLRNRRTVLPAFVPVLQEKLAHVAQRWGIPLTTAQALCEIEALDPQSDLYRQRMALWPTILKERWYPIHLAVLAAMAQTPRASSLVENLDSRLRGCYVVDLIKPPPSTAAPTPPPPSPSNGHF